MLNSLNHAAIPVITSRDCHKSGVIGDSIKVIFNVYPQTDSLGSANGSLVNEGKSPDGRYTAVAHSRTLKKNDVKCTDGVNTKLAWTV